MRFARAASITVPVLLAALAARPAGAYVRYITDAGKPYYWPVSCAAVTVYLNHFQQMTPDEVAKAITAAAHAWSPSEVTCTTAGGTSHPYFEVVPTISETGSPPAVGWDGHNTVIFRTESWTMSGKPDGKPYDSNALALTSVVARPDGRIVDADMEINAVYITTWVNFDSSNNKPATDAGAYDLQNAITHEFGHFIGLDHTCRQEPPDPTVVDDQGNPVPQCGPALPTAITNAVMYPTIEVSGSVELIKRTLSPDDVKAVCDIYPAALDPQNCPLDMPYEGCTGSCRTGAGRDARAPGNGLGVGATLLVAAVLVSLRRRCGGRRSPG